MWFGPPMMVAKQELGRTLKMSNPSGQLAEKLLLVAADVDLRTGRGHVSTGMHLVAERFFAEAELDIPMCRRSEVGVVDNGRRACCVGLTSSSKPMIARTPIVVMRAQAVQALARHINDVVSQQHPGSLFFVSTAELQCKSGTSRGQGELWAHRHPLCLGASLAGISLS